MTNKVLLLGCSGFTGIHFQNYIIKNKKYNTYNFICVDKNMQQINNFEYLKCDLSKYTQLEQLILQVKPDYIVNLVGTFGSDDFDNLLNLNTDIPKNIFEILKKNDLLRTKILLIGSAAEYGLPSSLPIPETAPLKPLNYYGLTKVLQYNLASFYHQTLGINYNIARTFNVIGKNISDKLCLGSFLRQINNMSDGDTIFVGNLSTKRDFLAIEDVVDAYWKILMNGKSGEVYNVCSGGSTNIKNILDILIANSGKDDIKIEVNKDFVHKNDIQDCYGNNRKLIHDTGWHIKHSIFDALGSL